MKLLTKTSVFLNENIGYIAVTTPRLLFRFLRNKYQWEFRPNLPQAKWWKLTSVETWDTEELQEFMELEDTLSAMAWLRRNQKLVVD